MHPERAAARTRPTILRALAGALALTGALAPAGCQDAGNALARGDELWADSAYSDALAEYRLSLARDSTDEDIRARVAHAYAVTGQFERAREHYQWLVEHDAGWADQAVFDYLALAARARIRGDRYGMAGAIEAALALRPALPVDQLAPSLARYYATTGEPARALDFYERALTTSPADSIPDLLYEIGEVHVAQGQCSEAIGYFNAFRNRAEGSDRTDQARWHIGNCSFQLGTRARQEGDAVEALRRIDMTITLGVPQNLLDQAWFERGEALLALGRSPEALQSFMRVVELSATRSGQLVDRAQQRIDQIRFGRI
jgi:tetratricopeptide (TPR) repeat protein